MIKKLYIYLILVILQINISHADTKVELRAIDRVTGRTFLLKAPIDINTRFESLFITPKVCHISPPDKQPESSAYLVIRDINSKKSIFEGWMFASSPSLNALEHPVYDVWLLGCNAK